MRTYFVLYKTNGLIGILPGPSDGKCSVIHFGWSFRELTHIFYTRQIRSFSIKHIDLAPQVSFNRNIQEVFPVISNIRMLHIIYLPRDENGGNNKDDGKHKLKHDQSLAKPDCTYS